MDFAWSSEQLRLREEARRVATDAVERYGAHNDSWIHGYSPGLSRELGARGWIGMGWPTEHGGNPDPVARLIVAEELISAGAPIAASWFGDRQIGPSIIKFGTAEQQRTHLPGIRSGETTWCIGMSEPDAGSDLASLRTSATREGHQYAINGRKIWTSMAANADFCFLICRTTTGSTGARGVSQIIVPMNVAGIHVNPIRDVVGSEHFCEVIFDDVVVPVENLVGEEGLGFAATMTQLEYERGGIDRLVSNWALYSSARARADTKSPLVRDQIAQLEIGYRIARMLIVREACGQAPRGFSAVTKCLATEHEQDVAEFVASVYATELTLWKRQAQGFCYSPGYTIMGGTSNVLRNVAAEQMLGMPRNN